MRKAVLIINWITVAILMYTTFTVDPTTPDAGYQYLGLLFGLLAVIYYWLADERVDNVTKKGR